MVKIKDLNEMQLTEFVTILQDIFEHSPWVARRAGEFRPFSSLTSLHEKMVQVVKDASTEEKLSLIQSHPHLGTRARMSSSSQHEQKNAGLHQLSPEEYEDLLALNKEYVNKFGFPFILAVRGKSKHEIYAAMKDRVNNSQDAECNQALTEIYKIALFRLEEKMNEK
jgi:2-oxo-4-hydroxy-4-carboxy-5-ureidoimidazoline decarboxylase